MDYSPLEKLSEELNLKISELKSGNMPAGDISALVSTAREVYERLVILKYQALEKDRNPSTETAQPTMPFRIETDAVAHSDVEINEETEAVSEIESSEETQVKPDESSVPAVVEEKASDTPPSSSDELAHTAETEEESHSPEVIDTNESEITEQISEKVEPAIATPIKIEASAPDVITEEQVVTETKTEETQPEPESASLLEQFENAPIEDIAKSISLNEKFQFIRVLCANNAKGFDALLEHINKCTSEKHALDTFTSSIPEPDADEDKLVYEKFMDLIKRRF